MAMHLMWRLTLQVCCLEFISWLQLLQDAQQHKSTSICMQLHSCNHGLSPCEFAVCLSAPGCVKDIRHVLVEQHGLAKCALYLQVCTLRC